MRRPRGNALGGGGWRRRLARSLAATGSAIGRGDGLGGGRSAATAPRRWARGDGLGGDGLEATAAAHSSSPSPAGTPKKFADYLDGKEPAKVYLRAADCGPRLWTVEVLFDGQGRMYLDKGWEKFAIAHGVDFGWFVHFKYEGDDVLTVKVFDGTMCRRYYYSDDEDTDDESDDDVKPCIHPL
ncbi:hypothetical protein QYE76_038991 [Lolium multiflorum]|uniref:TF-B3 domain-containing protein n=1 Tax=Lolium multiflorum TaxID=4521 RepID=A0AAD8TAI9_LOLMU|nr:hypothetical protein QYE76_038991 [Lolium multiflorum]